MKSNTISWLHREPEQENETKSQTGKFDSAEIHQDKRNYTWIQEGP